MKLSLSDDVKEMTLWIIFVLWLFALAYIGEGGQNLLINLFVVLFAIAVAIGLIQGVSESLEDYYWNKRETRKRQT